MRCVTLLENSALTDDLGAEHGLSLYIESDDFHLLFDMGATGLYAENAKKMGIDLGSVDAAVISHGHHDHGGGLAAFLRINDQARVYVNRYAFNQHFAKDGEGNTKYIGLDEHLQHHERLIFTGEEQVIREGFSLFAGASGEGFRPSGNESLLMEQGNELVADVFAHEQSLVIREVSKDVDSQGKPSEKLIMIAGCAHQGIDRIFNHFKSKWGRYPDIAIGGFHLHNRATGASESPERIRELAAFLMETGAVFYTGHCTGEEAYQLLKEIMGDRIHYLAGGSDISL
ncbi:MBL fold metallo-hydrolase [Anoxynatronum buryatiense]|uniref:7,8-dihydropterin-6-yl-methyl-4-(Beta-D-ribofuranosyl)aminobenzene 5'-phosphate synthase n=1 Tax=Anoxynatronum buryatiense TaxID=489973 RepID=A0AA45WTM6_9CLOT|nr:MBL fold metallo-hydrolase [Anoxynatronum buryatiense]SMP43248.1 7,8-dihydropterin-6-yl-methyl-4-(beta-D-ribofuranosyl)aminobenzene 5'-phosphate synthase [Anoxynatronum buryatiense]